MPRKGERQEAGNQAAPVAVVSGMTRGSVLDEVVDGAEPVRVPIKGGRRRVRTRWWVLGTATVVVLGVVWSQVGTGSGSGPASVGRRSTGAAVHGAAVKGPDSSGTNVQSSAAGSSAAGPSSLAGTSGATAAIPSASGAGSSQAASLPNEVPALPTRVIKTGTISVQVPAGKLSDVLGRVSQQAAGAGGFVAGSSEQAPSDSEPPSGSLTLRIPVARFEAFVAYVQSLGTVLSVSTSGQDVTASYVDLQARIAALQDTRTQFEQILARASTIGDILSVESQISDLETQIEQLQGQFNVLDNQTSYSSLTVNVAEKPKPGVVVRPPKPASGLSKSWAHARHSFAQGFEAVIGATGGIAVFLLFAGLLLLIGRLGWRAFRSRWAS